MSSDASLRPMRAVLGFTVAYMVVLFAYGTAVGSPLTGLYTWINLGLFVFFGVLHRWARWPLHALWAVSLVGFGNMAGGVFLVEGEPLYTAALVGNLRYDKFFHALASAAMTVVAWEAMKRWVGDGFHRGGTLLMTWLVVMGGGAVVEIAELIGVLTTGINVGDYFNNAYDLVANGLGAGVGLTVALWIDTRHPELIEA